MRKTLVLLVASTCAVLFAGTKIETLQLMKEKNTGTIELIEKNVKMYGKQNKEKEQKIKELLESMSTEEKVGQLFLARVPVEKQKEDIEKYHLGGYILFGRDVESETVDSLKEKIKSYQQVSNIPMFIASDEEGGTVSRLSRGNQLLPTPFLSPQEIYKQGGLLAVKNDIQKKAKWLKEYDIHLSLSPVVDVATESTAFIYERTLGVGAKETSAYTKFVVKEMKREKIVSTLKHFPGYGNNKDSHTEIVRDKRSLKELKENDFLPFEAGIKAGADSLLVSHNIIEAIDEEVPATISKKVHELIRNELKFKGVIMTDDLDMAGIAHFISQKEAGLRALEAGNDMIVSSSYQEQIPYIVETIDSNVLSEEVLNQSVMRILKMKQDIGLIE